MTFRSLEISGKSRGKNSTLTQAEVDRAAFLIQELLELLRPEGKSISFDAHDVATLLIGIERTEREACAKTAQEFYRKSMFNSRIRSLGQDAAESIAAAIRARGQT